MKLKELEIKIQIGSQSLFESVYASCETHFGPPTSELLQLDEYYDTPDKQLKKQDLVIRIRKSNGKQTIALKSPRINLPSGMSQRIELEFSAAHGEGVEQQLYDQGLFAFECAEKKRWTFIYKDCEIVLDCLPFIGSFVEIEGPDEIAIQKVVTLLNLSDCPIICKNYGELMSEKFQELNLDSSNIQSTFAQENLFIQKR